MPSITSEFEKVVRDFAPKNGEFLLENFKRMANAADETAKALINDPNMSRAKDEVEKLFKDSVPMILKADPAQRLELIHELNKKLTPLAKKLGTSIEGFNIAEDQVAQTAAHEPAVVAPAPVEPAPAAPAPAEPAPAEPAPVAPAPVAPAPVAPIQPAPTALPVAPIATPTATPATTPEPAPGSHEAVSEALTYERTRNYKSGHSTVRGVKPGFEDMPPIDAVKSRTLTGQVDIEGFDMDWRDSKWYKRFIDAAAALKFCVPLMDKDTQAWIAKVQPAIDVFAGLKDVPKNKWKREIWKFIAVDRKMNAPMIYAPGGALNFLLAFDRLLDVQPEVRVAALAGNAADLNKLNIAWIRMEKGVGKKRAEKAKERRATVRTYAEVVGSVPAPVVLPVDGAPVIPAPAPDPVQPVVPVQPTPQPPTPATAPQPIPPTPPTPGPVPPAPATAPGPAPAPDVNTYDPTMDTSPGKLKFGANQAFLDQYMMDASEFPNFVKEMEIFKGDDISVSGHKPLVVTDGNEADEAKISTQELDKWIEELGKSDDEYWQTMGVNWSDVSNRANSKSNAEVMKNFDPKSETSRLILLFNRLQEFKDMRRHYYFDSKRPIAVKLRTLQFLAIKRIHQYATEIDRDFNSVEQADGFHGAKKLYVEQLLYGFYKEPTSKTSGDAVPDDFWKSVEEPLKSDVLRCYKGLAQELASDSRSLNQNNAKKWLEDNKTELEGLAP